MKKVKFFLLFFLILVIGITTAQLEVGFNEDSPVVKIRTPEPPINDSIGQVNASITANFWDLLDTPLDFIWTRLDNFIFISGLEIDFNETRLNDSIDSRTTSITYNASTIQTTTGTLDSGNLASIQALEDGDSYNVSEDAGGSPLTILVNFTNIIDFNSIIISEWYDGGLGHEIELQLYNFNTDLWEVKDEITDMTGFTQSIIPVFDAPNHIDATGNVSIRIIHITNGNPSHNFFLDYLVLLDGFSTITTIEHDGLSGRDNIENHPWACAVDGSRNCSSFNNSYVVNGSNASLDYFDVNHIAEKTPGHGVVVDNILYANAIGTGLDVLHSATIGNHLTVLDNLDVGGIAKVDHIAEKTGDHGVVFDNDVNLSGNSIFDITGFYSSRNPVYNTELILSYTSLGWLDYDDDTHWYFNLDEGRNLTLYKNFAGEGVFDIKANVSASHYFGDGSQLINIPAYNLTYQTHLSSSGSDHSFIDQDVSDGSSPNFDIPSVYGLKIHSGGSLINLTIYRTGTITAERSLNIDVNDNSRTIDLTGNPTLGDWFNQPVKTISSPTFNSPTVNALTFDATHDIKTVFRGGYLLGFQAQDSGFQMTWEMWNKDGDGTDNNNLDIWAHGIPTNLANYELMQIGYITNANEALRYYKISSTAVDDGMVYPIKIYTGANTDQLRLNTGGEVIMAQAVDDALGNLRATYWDSATGQIGYDSSSIKYKENIKNMTDEKSSKIYELRPVTFDKIDGTKDQIGLIAEEVNELFPQCVFYKREAVMGECIDDIDPNNVFTYECIKSYRLEINKTTGKKIPEGINYECLIAPLIQELKDSKTEIDKLKIEVEKIKEPK